jgi:phosphomannomutase/phosphoglucomutase
MAKGPIKDVGFNTRAAKKLIGLALLIAVVVTGVWFAFGFLQKYEADQEQQRRAERTATAEDWASQLAQALAPLETNLERLAKDKAIRSVLKSGDQKQLDSMAEKARAVLTPTPLKIRLYLPRTARADSDSAPPLTFASLEMIRAAETSAEPVRAEVHLSGSPGEHLVQVRRVEDEAGNLLGVVHMSSDVALLRNAFSELNGIEGRLELKQRAGGKAFALAARGDDQVAAAEPVLVGVPGSRWLLSYSAPESAAAGKGGPWLWYALGGIAVVLVLFGMMRGRRGGVAVQPGRQQAAYEGAVKAIASGAHPSLERLIPGMKGYKQPPRAVAVNPAAAMPEVAVEEVDAAQLKASLQEGAGLDFDFGGEETEESPAAASEAPAGSIVPASIFRAYDIRGVVGETLTTEGVYEIGRAIGTEAEVRGQQTIVVARDGRNSSIDMADALINGLRDTGRDVIDIGMVPTPVLYFATHYLDTGSGVMVTGSHNPGNYNGLKIVLDGQTLSGEAISAIRQRIESEDLSSGAGGLQSAEIATEYIRRISEEVAVALGNPFKVVVDCGNGVPGLLAPKLLRALGHDVIELYCDIDGNFPNHHPDPSQPDNLTDLIKAVHDNRADLGLAFDGDGDRLGVVDVAGNVIWPDRLMMLFAQDVLARNPGAPIIFDVKCSNRLKQVIEQMGGQPLMWRTGHSLIKAKMQEVNSPLAGEMSGHIFFKERWYGFDDALYAAARLLEILNNQDQSPTEVFAALPSGVSTPELRIDLPESKHAAFMQAFIAQAQTRFAGAEMTTIDGLRVDFPNGWGLLRPSNTSPCLVCRFEGDDAAALEQVKAAFRDCMQAVAPDMKLPF